MRDTYRSLLTALGAILALWLILGFWPLSTGSRVALGLLVALVAGVIFWCQYRGSLARATAVREIVDESLPPEDFQGAVIFVCGDNAPLFVSGTRHRETRQGWYLWVKDAEQLPLFAQHLSLVRPAVASLAPLPEALTPAQQEALAQRGTLPSTFIRETQQQLARLDKLPPDWNISYSLELLAQLQTLRPGEAKSLTSQWQQKFYAAALPVDAMNSWYEGMMKLQQLSHRLSSLDEQKGKYITVSELKSVVFSTIQSFNQTLPAEEQLRRLSQHPAGDALPEAEKTQLELRLRQLAARYAQIKQDSSAQ